MPGLPNFRYDTLSFWLGFLAATLFWWIFSRIRPQIPKLVEKIKANIRENRRRSEDRIDEFLRRETLRRAQGMHLAAPLFSLDEIVVEPSLLPVPPSYIIQGAPPLNNLTSQVIPYLPDWPELVAQYSLPVISPAAAIHNGVRIAVIGQPGSGKTVLLANMASQAARHDPALGDHADLLPILLHALDLNLADPSWEQDPFAPINKVIVSQSPTMIQPQIPKVLHSVIMDGRGLLLLDGLDELPPPALQTVSKYLAALVQKAPQLYMIVSAAPENLDGLNKAGFLPLAITAWGDQKREAFTDHWGELWQTYILPDLTKQGITESIDASMLNNWLASETGFHSPLEWTLKVWGTYAGDLQGPSAASAVDAAVQRFTQKGVQKEVMALLASEFINSEQAGISYSDLEKFLTGQKITIAAEPSAEEKPEAAKLQLRKRKNEQKISSGGRILNSLLNAGLLVEHPGDILRFAHPVFTGYLAGFAGGLDSSFTANNPVWSQKMLAGRYLAARNQAQALVENMLKADSSTLFTNLLAVARWLKDVPPDAPWRPAIMRRLVTLIQSEKLTFGLRARFLGAFVTSNDPSVTLLFKQLLGSDSPKVRQLAAIGGGAVRSKKLVDDFIGLLGDSCPEVRYAACLALSAYNDKVTNEAVYAALIQGDEGLQQVAAESMAGKGEQGYTILKETLKTDNLMARRAAVLGLSQIREPWALQILETLAIEDAQWIVRTIATQAAESLEQPNPYTPHPQPIPSEAAWIITYASKQGQGVARGEMPTELLLSALQSGSQDEKLAAMTYLRDQPDNKIISIIYEMAFSEDAQVNEAALYSLWRMETCGVEMPPPPYF